MMPKPPHIVPVTDFIKDAATVINALKGASSPTIVTQRGRAAAVLMSINDYEQTQEELGVLRAILSGERDIARCDLHDADDVFDELDELLAPPHA